MLALQWYEQTEYMHCYNRRVLFPGGGFGRKAQTSAFDVKRAGESPLPRLFFLSPRIIVYSWRSRIFVTGTQQYFELT